MFQESQPFNVWPLWGTMRLIGPRELQVFSAVISKVYRLWVFKWTLWMPGHILVIFKKIKLIEKIYSRTNN